MSKLSDLTKALADIDAKLEKARTEITGKIAELQTALENTDIPAEAQAALDALSTSAQALDDIVPDASPVV